MSAAEDPGVWGGIIGVIGALAAVVRGENRSRDARAENKDTRKTIREVRAALEAELAQKMEKELCKERTKRIEGDIAALDGKMETGFKNQAKALERIEGLVRANGRSRGAS